jgi:hypothetical protein
MSDGFWDKVKAQHTELCTAGTADEVLAIVSPERNPYGPEWKNNTWEGFFVSGLEDTMQEALTAAGWRVTWSESAIYYVMTAPNGDQITYCEGDVGRGDKHVKAVTAPPEEKPVKAPTEREAYVTEQVAVWIENDGKHYYDAVTLANKEMHDALKRYLTKTIRYSRKPQAAWHVGQELAPNDWDRIDWVAVADRLKTD